MGEAHMNDIASGSWTLVRDAESLAWLTIDKPGTSANVLSSGVLAELDGLLAALERDRPCGVVVISAKKSGFIAGADIREFTGITDAASGYELIHRGQEVLNRLARLPCPSVAAIHGLPSAAVSSWRSRAAIAWAWQTIDSRWDSRRCSSASTRVSAAPCGAYARSASAPRWR